jgi:hypothetical protein
MERVTEAPPQAGVIARLSGYVANALWYWEPRRLVFNAVLAVVVLIHFVLAWPRSKDLLSFDLLLGLFILSVLANFCYSAVYVPDLFVQFARLNEATRWGRVILFTVGTGFAATLTHFFAKGIFSS